jgi:hypothetical protein
MDAATRKHFDAWMEHMFRADERRVAEPILLVIYWRDPERYHTEGWPCLLRDAETEFGNLTMWDEHTLKENA